MKRLAHKDPHVVVLAIALLDSCVNNCGKVFHLEVASRDFENEFRRLLTQQPQPIPMKLKLVLKKWSENEFKNDQELNLIPSLYEKLKQEGNDFSDSSAPIKSQPVLSKDPNVVNSQQEEDDIAKAIELSLKEKSASPQAQTKFVSIFFI